MSMNGSMKEADYDPRCSYHPYEDGRYRVAPMLRPFGSEFGNPPELEAKYFQIDDDFPHYHSVKQRSRERAARHFGEHRFGIEQKECLCRFIAGRLAAEHPCHFRLHGDSEAQSFRLECHLTGGGLEFGGGHWPLDDLVMWIQEDIAAWTCDESRDWMAYAAICFPNHWAPEAKIGRDFFAVHEEVGGAAPMLKSSRELVRSMIHKGPFVRFAWGLATDTRLNHHPLEPAGRCFDPQNPGLWLRVERQTLHGFPEQRMAFFSIRTYFEDAGEIKNHPARQQALRNALLSMSPGSRQYKGIAGSFDDIIGWLDQASP